CSAWGCTTWRMGSSPALNLSPTVRRFLNGVSGRGRVLLGMRPGGEQAELMRAGDGMRAVSGTEFGQDPFDVRADGFLRQVHRLSGIGAGVSVADPGQNLEFAWGQTLARRGQGPLGERGEPGIDVAWRASRPVQHGDNRAWFRGARQDAVGPSCHSGADSAAVAVGL